MWLNSLTVRKSGLSEPVGDISLITLKGYRILQQADIVIYAGSLINTDLLDYCKDGVESYDSAAMTLDDIITVMVDGVKSHKLVVRLQTGDLSLYGSIREQGEVLAEHNIGFSAIPCQFLPRRRR